MTGRHWALGVAGVLVVTGSTALLPTSTTAASPPVPKQGDPALGQGLGRLLADSERPALRRRVTTGVRLLPNALAIRDQRGRVLVHLTPQADADQAAFRRQAERAGLAVQSVDPEKGTLEGFVPLGAVRTLADLEETGTLVQAAKPETHVGDATSQGVPFQRVDKVLAEGVDGSGITIGALSDSYDAATELGGEPIRTHAADDVRSGDLPGRGNPRNRTPVVVLEDLDPGQGASDEGRAMLQLAHDVAPGAKLCFATAFTGLLGFADNIRRLADDYGPCRADVVVDDVGYFDEPMFSDSALSDAIDEVADKGVHYFTSAGNDGVQQSWNSEVRLVPAAKGVTGTNIDLSEVDPELYDGGLQDLDPGRGTDIAQDINIGAGGAILNFQWNDPVDVDGATIGDPYFTDTGEVTDADPEPTFTFTPTADQLGQDVLFRTDAIPSGTTDLVLSVDAPDGTNLGTIDTGSSPEQLATELEQAGDYTITVSGFDGDTGDFTVDVVPVLSPSRVTTDFNLLVFDMDGNYLFPIADANRLSGRPQELAVLGGPGDVQLVVSRAGTGSMGATRLRHVLGYEGAFTEYTDPTSPAMVGHTFAKGATAVAAYDPFRPFLPEVFTSPGGDLPVYFDSAGNRYPKPQIRRVPQVAATDGGNTTFFFADNPRDADDLPNFFGTSASAPHAAAIGALALDQNGGGDSLSPVALRRKLARSAFTHDLDPAYARGRSGGLTITARGPQGYENYAVPPQSMVDPRFFTLTYDGDVPLESVTFFGETASPTALGERRPPYSDGIVFDRRRFDGESPYRDDGFPFTIGGTSGGLRESSISAKFTQRAGGESVAGQYRRMTLRFTKGLRDGQALQFNVDRDLAISGFGGSNEGNGADELGGQVFYPQNRAIPYGLGFIAVREDGTKIYGAMRNRLGRGFSPVDGYGLINAEKAVLDR